MSKERTYTKKGYEALLAELAQLEELIEKNKKDISTARAFGDLSENSEYTEAKEEQRKLAYRKDELRDMIKNAVVVRRARPTPLLSVSAPSLRCTWSSARRMWSITSSALTRPIPSRGRSRISPRSVLPLSASARVIRWRPSCRTARRFTLRSAT